MKISVIAPEGAPFVRTGDLAEKISGLCQELALLGHDVDLLLPLYLGVSIIPTKFIGPMRFGFGGRQIPYSILETKYHGVRVIFFDAPQYFQRTGIYRDSSGEFSDNDERFVFFTRASLDYYFKRDEKPDVFHCHDWQTSLLPLYLQTHYREEEIGRTPALLTVHNIEYQGVFGKERFSLLDLGWEHFTSEGLEFYGSINFLKAGLVYADLINTSTADYAKKIQTPEYGFRLDGVIRSKSERLHWIEDEAVIAPDEVAKRYLELYEKAIQLKT